MTLYLVRHGPVLVDRRSPPSEWALDMDAAPSMAEWAGRLPQHSDAHWVSSPEPKAIATARRLTKGAVAEDPRLGEVRRGGWDPNYEAAVVRFLAEPAIPPAAEWESAAAAGQRFVAGVRHHAAMPAQDVVVVTHGLVLTLLRAHLSGQPADVRSWKDLRFPDVLVLAEPDRRAWLADDSFRCAISRPA